jgi:hypothetical protein
VSYLGALATQAAPAIGAPPTAPKNIGTAPPPTAAQAASHAAAAEPPPYDVAKDPGWAGIVHPADHALQGVLNNLTPEERQVLQQRVHAIIGGGNAGQPQAQPGKSFTGNYTVDGKNYTFQWNGDRPPTPAEIMQAYQRHQIDQRTQFLNQQMQPGAVPPGVPPNSQVPLSTSRAPGTI